MVAKEKVIEWYLRNIPKPKELDSKIEATLEYIKRFNEPDEEGDWVVFAYEVIDGRNGQYTIPFFLEEVVGGTWDIEQIDMDDLVHAFDEAGAALAAEFTKHSKLGGSFYVGHNEANGSLGVFYCVRA